MIPFNIILLTEPDMIDQTTPSPSHPQLWKTIEMTIQHIDYRCESVKLDQLDFNEQDSNNKVLNADLVIMVRYIPLLK